MSQEIRDQVRRGILEGAQVDRESGRLTDVALLGRVSENNRIYTDRALEDATRLYAEAPVYLDHPTKREMRDRSGVRSVRDLAGKVVNPRRAGDQVRGDLHLLEAEPARSLLLSLAEQMPEQVGMSHRAHGEVQLDEEGRQIVQNLDDVYGVELVTDPATVEGLVESLDRRHRKAKRREKPNLLSARQLTECHLQIFGR